MSESGYFDKELSGYECQDVFFPDPLPKPNNTKREMLIDYGNCGHVYIDNTSGKTPICGKEHFLKNKLSAKYPTLPLAETALVVDYPFKDRIMGENLNNIIKARNLVYYINRLRGLWVSKVPFSLLNPLKRVIEEMKTGENGLKQILSEKASPILRGHLENYHYLLQKGNVENYNSAYVGGCLTALKAETGDCTVCFPSGPKFTNLNVRQIVPDEKDSYFYQYNDGIEMNIGHSIYEVRSTTICGTRYCALRCGSNRCHLLRFQDEDFNSTVNIIETVNETPTSICPSPYIEGESLIATDSGTVHIWRVGKGLDAVILDNPKRFKCTDDWRQVHYGACPQEIVVADRTHLKMFDRRTKCESSVDLFALPNNILLNSERISATCKHPVNPFQHVTCTDYSLLVTDQRFPGHPVMYWNHILEKCPALLSVYNDDHANYNSSLVLLASQYPAETCCFQFQQNSNEPVHSTQTPWRLSKISDMREFDCPMLNSFSLLSEKRFDTSLCGVAALPGFDKQSLLTLQLDSHGELFYQVYSQKGNDFRDLTCSAGPGNSSSFFSPAAQEKARTWMLSLESNVNQLIEQKSDIEGSVFDVAYFLPVMMNVSAPKELCPNCEPGSQEFEQDVNDFIDEPPCPACGLTFQVAKSLRKAEKEENIADISCNGFERFCNQVPSYEEFPHESARSNIFIKLWKEDSDISEYVKKADKDTRKYKEKYKKKQKSLTKILEKRRERFRILRRHGHDINSLYVKNRNNPFNLDKSIKALAAQYPDEDQTTTFKSSTRTKTLSSFESQLSMQPDYKSRITRLLHDSQNLSQLQHLPSSCSSSIRSESICSKKPRKGKRMSDAASETSQILADVSTEEHEEGHLSEVNPDEAVKDRKSKSKKPNASENENIDESPLLSAKKSKSKKKLEESAISQESQQNEDEGREFSSEDHSHKRKSKKKKHPDSESDYSSSQHSTDSTATCRKKKSKKKKKGSNHEYDSSSTATDSDDLNFPVDNRENLSEFDSNHQDLSENEHMLKDKTKTSKLLQRETASENSTSNEIFKVPVGLPPRRNKLLSLSTDKNSKKPFPHPSFPDENRTNQETPLTSSTMQLKENNVSARSNVVDLTAKNTQMVTENELVGKKKKKKKKKSRNDMEGKESDASVESDSSLSSFGSEISLFSNHMDIGETETVNEEGSGDEHRQSKKRKKKHGSNSASDDNLDSNDSSVYTSDQDSGSDRSQKKKRKKKRMLTSTSQDPDASREPDETVDTMRSQDVASSTVPENVANNIPKEEVSDIRRKQRKKSNSQLDNVSSSDTIIRSETDLDTQRSRDQSQIDALSDDDSNDHKSFTVLQNKHIPQDTYIQTGKPRSHRSPVTSRVISNQIPTVNEPDARIDQKSFAEEYGVQPEYTGDVVIGYVCENVGDKYPVESGNTDSFNNRKRINYNNTGVYPPVGEDGNSDIDKESASQANISIDNTPLHQKSKIKSDSKHSDNESFKESGLVDRFKSGNNNPVSSDSTLPRGSHHDAQIKTEKMNEEESANLNLSFSPHFSSTPHVQLQHKPVLRTKSKVSKKKKAKFAIGF